MRYVVPKGFIAIDGTSLTVCDVNHQEGWFSVMLVAYTQQKITLPTKKINERVNIEVDVMSKYVERSMDMLEPRLEALEKVALLQSRLLVGGAVLTLVLAWSALRTTK